MADDEDCHRVMTAKLQALKTLAANVPGLAPEVAQLDREYAAAAARCFAGSSGFGQSGAYWSRFIGRAPLRESVAAANLVERMDSIRRAVTVSAPVSIRSVQADESRGHPGSPTRADERRLERAAATYANESYIPTITECVYDVCSCGARMSVNEADSCLNCEACGEVRPLEGVIFDDSQLYAQEGQKTKSGRFDPQRHLRTWLNQIQAIDTKPGDEAETSQVAEIIREKAQCEHEMIAILTVADVRRHLKELGKSGLNPHVSLLLKKLTGCGPPALPPEVELRIMEIFMAELALERGRPAARSLPSACVFGAPRFAGTAPIVPFAPAVAPVFAPQSPPLANRSIRMYYPNYIRRILEDILPARSPYRDILRFIYVQEGDSADAEAESWRHTRSLLDPTLFCEISSAR